MCATCVEAITSPTTDDGLLEPYPRALIIPKSDRAERERGLAGRDERSVGTRDRKDRQWDIPGSHSTPRANHHPTVKPLDLMRHLVRLVTPVDGVCLDPFLGSGTTALAASELGIRCIGIEREAEYLEIAKGRLLATPMGLGLDVPAPTKPRKDIGDGPMNRLRDSVKEKGRNPHQVEGWNFGKNTLRPDEEPAA